MKSAVSGVLLVLGLVSVCFGQGDGGLKKTHRAPIATSAAPVSEAEADATFQHVADLFKAILHINVTNSHAKSSTALVTKAEVVAEMTRFYKAAQPAFTLTPKLVKVDLPRVTIDKPSEKANLIMLIERGCVGNYGPLATGKTNSLSVQEFGDAVGYFLCRIAECTHTPSTKWTPYLHGN